MWADSIERAATGRPVDASHPDPGLMAGCREFASTLRDEIRLILTAGRR